MFASIIPLDEGKWIHGCFGLEMAYVQGRLLFKSKYPVQISKVKIELQGSLAIDFVKEDSLIIGAFSKYLLHDEITLDVSQEVSDLDFPFAFELSPNLTHYDQEIPDRITSPGLLIPSPISLNGTTKNGYPWSVKILYKLSATIFIPGRVFKSWITEKTCSVEIIPLLIYDPRLVPHLLHPEIRRWRSPPASIIEYDIEVGNIVIGPTDNLDFGYRLQVPFDSSKNGIRIKSLTFTLTQTIILGRVVYKKLMDIGSQDIYLSERYVYKSIKSSTEVLKWEEVQYVPPESEGTFELSEISSRSFPNLRQSADKYSFSNNTMRPGKLGGGGDGIYVEGYTQLQIPSLGDISPSTFKHDPSVTQVLIQYPKNQLQRIDPLFETHHSIKITIELYGSEKINLESPIIISCISKNDCKSLLEECPEIVPALDYERAMGTDIWVPEYKQ